MNTVNQNFRLIEDIAIAAAAYRFVDRVEGMIDTAATTVTTWSKRQNSRRYLSQMDDRMLQDIGLNRSDVDVETKKHFWEK